ncbi:hypothetical protein Q4519_21170 [Motilimonas sp. 1_MG-2023]|uniref:hypothetical protein n=1 Tax=Motilimonas sp. 1_MG-2023 TaxID=3062672 RepID=UPI0026E30CD5|nr:hypothetical protein [Motilimonas sp. 1_MG-2023]MDO6528182.1 hypothetical protein [Motilimonas sp. 1_MG-2023]
MRAELPFNSIREINWYLYKLGLFPAKAPSLTVKSGGDYIKQALHSRYKNAPEKVSLEINHLHQHFESEAIPDDIFNWVDLSNERQCTWLFLDLRNIMLASWLDENFLVERSMNSRCMDIVEQQFIFPRVELFVNSNPDKISRAIAFFDVLESEKRYKINYIYWLMRSWKIIDKQNYLLKWLDKKNNEQIDWVMEYLSKQESFVSLKNACMPVANVSKYSILVSAVDLFNHYEPKNTPRLELLIIKMKKAWSQKKHRDGLKGRKAYNVIMSTDAKQKLKVIADARDYKQNETIENLINEAYEKHLVEKKRKN